VINNKRWEVICGDSLEVLRGMADASVDAVVTDPPAGIAFMGKKWDHDKGGRDAWIAWLSEILAECRRVLKPGGHAFVWALPRTSHWTGMALEDAGFEVRERVAHIAGSGFPKSLDVSKALDLRAKKHWLNVSKAIDTLDHAAIIDAWKRHSSGANGAGVLFAKSAEGAGTSTRLNASAPDRVLLRVNPENGDFTAITAELKSNAARHTREESTASALETAVVNTTESLNPAGIAGKKQENRVAIVATADFFAQPGVWDLPDGKALLPTKGAEALKTWLGSKRLSDGMVTDALCAALADDLKRTILSHSVTFRSYDTTRQTACVSATSVTITESTAASLISFTADTLKAKAIDKAAGAEREVVGSVASPAGNGDGTLALGGGWQEEPAVTAPATPDAQKWNGWGTALKPAVEDWWLARKPFNGTVAACVVEHGTGAINVDACRVGTQESTARPGSMGVGSLTRAIVSQGGRPASSDWKGKREQERDSAGRFPPNLLLSHSALCVRKGTKRVRGISGGTAPIAPNRVPVSPGTVAVFNYAAPDGTELVDAWDCAEGCPVAELSRQSGVSTSKEAINGEPSASVGYGVASWIKRGASHSDTGTASRFFPQLNPSELDAPFRYVAKADRAERERGCEHLPAVSGAEAVERKEGSAGLQNPRAGAGRTAGKVRNNHPTVKPVALMAWLCRLITPPGGLILDPFCGSGSTGVAALAQNFRFLGIDQDPHYCDIARARIEGDAPLLNVQLEEGKVRQEKTMTISLKQLGFFGGEDE
jgi:site-specific DNA-methyltransferase (adenine-specific)